MTEQEDNNSEKNIFPVSVLEARRRLQILKPHLKTLRETYQKYSGAEISLRNISKSEKINEISRCKYDLDQIEEKLQDLQLIFLENDCVIKDISTGLIDFVALRKDQPVWLCYKDGEENLLYYHHWNTGFGGRKVIDFE